MLVSLVSFTKSEGDKERNKHLERNLADDEGRDVNAEIGHKSMEEVYEEGEEIQKVTIIHLNVTEIDNELMVLRIMLIICM